MHIIEQNVFTAVHGSLQAEHHAEADVYPEKLTTLLQWSERYRNRDDNRENVTQYAVQLALKVIHNQVVETGKMRLVICLIDVVLQLNQFKLTMPEREVVAFTTSLAEGVGDIDKLIEWLAEYTENMQANSESKTT